MVKYNRASKLITFFACSALLGLTSPVFAGSPGQYIDDATITAKVKEAIFADSKLKVLQINVATKDGTVSLKGVVDTTEQETKAVKIAGEVKGVNTVTDNLATRVSDDDDHRYGNH